MAKERISLTLDQDLVERIDRRLTEKGIDNRSRGIEELLEESLKKEAVTTAVILAGGDDPNCLININGRPVIEHTLDHLADAGVETAYIATSDPNVEDAVADHPLTPTVVMEDTPQGTAGALRQIADDLQDTFAVVNGDVLCRVDLADMKAAHEETGGLATIALTTVRNSSEYGVIRMKRNKVVGFQEKPEESFSHLVNAGVYLLEPALLDRLPAEEPANIEDLFETLADEGQLNGYVYDGEWREVG